MMDGSGSAKPISQTDVEAIRDKIGMCQEVAHSIRGKSFQLNGREAGKQKETAEKTEPSDIGQELKDKLSNVHDLLSDAFNSLSAFV